MRLRLLLAVTLVPLATASAAGADPWCDTLMGFIHDVPLNAVATKTLPDIAGPQTVARVPLPGARCLVSSWNPTGVARDHPPEQSVYCYWNAGEDSYRQVFDATNTRVAACMGAPASDDSFTTRLEYDSNYGVVRLAIDEMTNDWTVSVTVMPLN